MNNIGLYDILTKIRIAKSNNKFFIKRCLDEFFISTNMNSGESKTYIENLICHAENSTPEDVLFISPQKQEWLKGLSAINCTPTGNKSTFRDRILKKNKDAVLAALHPIIGGKGGVELAKIIRTLQDEGIISTPSFSEISNEFDIKYTKQAYNNNINNRFTPQELEPLKKAIRAAIPSGKQ